jgi:GntR family transcriptional regulator
MLARCHLDRNSEVPLFRQLHAAIEMAIIEGDLPDGASLPSVRVLARELDVAPVTVVQAYKELQQSGLIQAVPKRGFFVSVAPTPVELNGGYRQLQELVDNAIAVALRHGIDEREFSRIAVERARRFRSDQRVVAVFGFKDASLALRVEKTREGLSDINVEVTGISFEEVEGLDSIERDNLLGRVDYFLVSVGQIEQAAMLLGGSSARIQPMTRTPIPQVEEFVRSRPPDTRFGIVADSQEYANRMIAVLRRIRPTAQLGEIAIARDSLKVVEVIRSSDAVLVGSIAATRLDPRTFEDPRVIEFTSVPDQATLQKLRDRILDSRNPASRELSRVRSEADLSS